MTKSVPCETYYDQLAAAYDQLYTDAVSVGENSIVGSLIREYFLDGVRILDLGCGSGLALELLKERHGHSASRYVGIDISSRMAQAGREKFRSDPNAEFHVMDMQRLSHFGDASVDVVLSLFGSFSHALNHDAAIAEFQRVLRPGGRFLVMVYSRFSLRNILHACLKLSPGLLAEVHPYEIRRASGPPFIDARFYSRKLVHDAFGMFDDVCVDGLNCLFEMPLFNTYFRNPTKRAVIERLLRNEMKRLALWPYLCHSLIITGRRPQ
jgi:ubiquinone/menaquinone biosynthesis C-methylase UbiE